MLKLWISVALAVMTLGCSSSHESELSATNRPKAYKSLCKLGETCSLSREARVAFGADGVFVYKLLSGTFSCTVATFGTDPIPRKKVKECSIPTDLAESPLNPPPSEKLVLQAALQSALVQLSWTPLVASKSIIILRDIDSAPLGRVQLATLSGASSVYKDSSAVAGTQYWYWLKSIQADGTVLESASVSVKVESEIPPDSGDDACRAGATIKDRVVDCGGKTIGLSCNADSESQPPVLTLINASVKNLRIAANGGSDGIHCTRGDCTLENVVWEDICEDAATHKSEGGTMTIIGGSAYNDATGPGGKPDKIFQHNSKNSTTVITGGFTVKGQHGKLWRSCGDCSGNGGPRELIIDDVIIDGTVSAGVAGANRNYGDKVQIRKLRVKGYKLGKPSICDEYSGVVKGQGSSKKIGEFFGTPTCLVSPDDVVGF